MPGHSAILPTKETSGNVEQMCLAAGTSVGLIHEIEPAGAVVARIATDLDRILGPSQNFTLA